MFEYHVFKIPRKFGGEHNAEELEAQLNELGAQGWHVVGVGHIQPGISSYLLLERVKPPAE